MADHVDDDDDEYSSSEFIDMLDKQTQLPHVPLSQQRKLSSFANLQVFMSSTEGDCIQKFASILKGLRLGRTKNILIQFWVPIKIGDKCFLITTDQPFGLLELHKGLCQYRLHSMGYKYCMDDDREENQLGVPGRVFRHLMPELSPDVSYYSVEEYPQLDLSLRSGVRESYVAPVIESSTSRCVGVVEFVSTGPILDAIYEFWFAVPRENLEIFGLRCAKIPMTPSEGIVDEIEKMMKAVGKAHQLPACQQWYFCGHYLHREKNYLFPDVITDEDYMFPDVERCWFDPKVCGFRWLLETTHIRKGNAVVGRVFSCYKPYYCPDLSQFSISEYPLLHCARKYGLNSCFAMYIRRDNDSILEFFLPTENAGDPRSLMESVLATIEEQLPKDYKVGIGEGPFVDFSVEAVMLNMVRVNSRDEPLTVEVIELENENSGVLSLSEGEGRGTTMEDQPLMVAIDVIAKPSEGDQIAATVSVVAQLTDKEGTATAAATTEEEEQIRGAIPFSKENLKQYFGIGIKRHEAAEIFGVSVATFKRKLRDYGIERWNSPNRRNDKSSIDVTDKTIDENDQTNGGPCVEPLPIDMEEASTNIVTIKAKYKSDIVKFRLSSSPGVAELRREVTDRFNLKEGSFKIKYKDKDGDWILIVRDEDLQECINEYRSMGVGIPINMRIQHEKTR